MYDFGNPIGESCYRLISRSGQFIYLKTKGILEIDEKMRQVRSFVCINTLVTDEEGKRLIKEMKKKFSAIISKEELSAMESDVSTVENPLLLERAILNLITNLNNGTYDDDDTASVISNSTVGDGKQPLAIIPPNMISIKPTISKAVDVISQVGGKSYPEIKNEPKSPENCDNHQPNRTPNYHSQWSTESSTPLSVKVEPGTNYILSPTSSYSLSSHDSDVCSPQPQSSHIASTTTNRNVRKNVNSGNNCKSDDYYSTYDNLPTHYDTDTSIRNSSSDSFSSNYSNNFTSAKLHANDSIAISLTSGVSSTNTNYNNNNANINQNSVLKRTHRSADGDNDDENKEFIKKRTLTNNLNCVPQNPPIDLLATSGSGNLL